MIKAEDHLRLVPWAFHKRVRPRLPGLLWQRVDYDDILSAGYLGLTIAAERYHVVAGATFAGYALPCIYRRMWDEVRILMGWKGSSRHEELPVVRLPEFMLYNLPFHDPALELVGVELERLLLHLTPQQRFLIEEICIQDRTVTEVAEWLGIPMTVASKRYRYALGKLRDIAAGCAPTRVAFRTPPGAKRRTYRTVAA